MTTKMQFAARLGRGLAAMCTRRVNGGVTSAAADGAELSWHAGAAMGDTENAADGIDAPRLPVRLTRPHVSSRVPSYEGP